MPRPQYGQSFQQFPAATRRDLTPESFINEQVRINKQQIQNKYALQWKEVNRSRRFIVTAKANTMLQNIDAKAKQEMLQLSQQAQQQMIQLQNIDRLAQQGAVTNPEQIKARMMFGADVAGQMYPTPRKERTIPQQFGELDVYSHRISQELENFRLVGGKKPSKAISALGKISPLVGIAASYQAITHRPKKPELQIWDPSIPTKVEGEDMMGDWRKAEPGEIETYEAWLAEERDVAERKTELLGQPSISRRIAQPGTKGGTFGDKIAESVRPRRTPTAAKPKVIRQRNTRTGKERISYDKGKTWQIVSG
ncbi:hypothetical protein KA005_07010 [bacterium]|nr:hypothetical protein [bacterium]